MDRVTCTGCSLLCDDIIIRTDGLYIDEIIGACLKGKERFDQITAKNRIINPFIRKNGELEKVSWDEAFEKVLTIMKTSSKPLLYGFSNSSCEAQLKGIRLAKKIDGFIDSNSTICQGKTLNISRDSGMTLTTISEIINNVDTLILWGLNAAESIPRLLNKTLFTRGKFRMTGREIKTLIIVDPVKSSSFGVMGPRDLALFIEPNRDLELIKILKDECCTADSIPSGGGAGLDESDIRRMLQHLQGAENAVIFVGQGILTTQGNENALKELLELIELVNIQQKKGRISLVMVGGHYNMAGFDHVALSETGKNQNLQFTNNQIIKSNDTIISKIKNEDFDYTIIVGTDPISHLPHQLSSKLASKPIILIDNRKSGISQLADVVLPTAITGIECAGLAYRLDQVPIELKKLVNPPNNVPSDEELLDQIIERLSKK